MDATYSNLVANFSAGVRSETVNGREFLVAPLTLIVPGVLHGSKGPLYYPPHEIAKNVEAWNGMPLVVLHPTRNGAPISGRDPKVMAESEIGRVYNAKIGSGGKLQAEGWFDVESTNRADHTKSIIPRLRKGQPVELSTGLFTQNQPKTGVFNGRSYTHVAMNYRPDHLAILPDRKGACSTEDGCGVLVNERQLVINSLSSKRRQPMGNKSLAEFVANVMKPSTKLKKDGMSPSKACKILEDGETNGVPLSKKQKGMFGALCGQRPTKNEDEEVQETAEQTSEEPQETTTTSNDSACITVNCGKDGMCESCKAKVAATKVENTPSTMGYDAHKVKEGEMPMGECKCTPEMKAEGKCKCSMKREEKTEVPADVENAEEGQKQEPEQVTNAPDGCVDKCKEACAKAMKSVGAKNDPAGAKEGSYFDNCPRDQKGHCKKSGGTSLPSEASGAAGGGYFAARNEDYAEGSMGLFLHHVFNCGGPGSGVPGPCPGGSSGKKGGAKLGAAFGGGSKGGASKSSKSGSTWTGPSKFGAKKADAKTSPTSKSAAPAAKPKTTIKVSAPVMKAAKKLAGAVAAAKKSGDKAAEAKAKQKLAKLVDKAKKNEGKNQKGKVGEKLEKKAAEKGKTTESKGVKDRGLGKVTTAKVKAAAKIAEAGAKAAASGDKAKAAKAKAKLAKIVEKANPDKKSKETTGGRERKKGQVTKEKVKALEKYTKAAEAAAKSGDKAKLKKINAKMRKLVERSKPTQNHSLIGTSYDLTVNEQPTELVCDRYTPIYTRAARLAYFITNYHATELGVGSEPIPVDEPTSNANPQQPRGEHGRWDTPANAERYKISSIVKKMFGGNDVKPIQAMADKPNQGDPDSDSEQDAEAEAAHSPSAAMAATVANSFVKKKITAKKEEEEHASY